MKITAIYLATLLVSTISCKGDFDEVGEQKLHNGIALRVESDLLSSLDHDNSYQNFNVGAFVDGTEIPTRCDAKFRDLMISYDRNMQKVWYTFGGSVQFKEYDKLCRMLEEMAKVMPDLNLAVFFDSEMDAEVVIRYLKTIKDIFNRTDFVIGNMIWSVNNQGSYNNCDKEIGVGKIMIRLKDDGNLYYKDALLGDIDRGWGELKKKLGEGQIVNENVARTTLPVYISVDKKTKYKYLNKLYKKFMDDRLVICSTIIILS